MIFQKKLLLTYSLSIVFITILVGGLFYGINSRFLKANLDRSYIELAGGMIRQIDNLYGEMDLILVNLLSSEEIKATIESLEFMDQEAPRNLEYLNDAKSVFDSSLLTYSIIRDFHSVLYTNGKHDHFSSNFIDHDFTRLPVGKRNAYDWLAESSIRPNGTFLIPPHGDPLSEHDEIFGFGRIVVGRQGRSGYFLAQKDVRELESILHIEDNQGTRVAVIDTHDGSLFYSTATLSSGEICHLASLEENDGDFQRNLSTGIREKNVFSDSMETGLRVVITFGQENLRESVEQTTMIILAGGALLLLVSFTYNYFSSRYLTRPLRRITEMMNVTELNKNPEPLDMTIHHDEILDLSTAFYELVERLNAATKKEIQYATSWLQARFDALQEQINPHFIFNSLTVISRRAFELGDDEIQTTCDCLISMLRYSTSTVERSATIADEIDHLRNYLVLMKKRLGKRLEYHIDVDRAILAEPMPKIVMQQLVENAIDHGYRAVNRTRRIQIRGRCTEGRWELAVMDDGEGFDPKVLQDIRRSLAQLEQETLDGHLLDGMEIGGMGLVNTWLRLFIFYDKAVDWRILSEVGKGSTILISAPLSRTGGFP